VEPLGQLNVSEQRGGELMKSNQCYFGRHQECWMSKLCDCDCHGGTMTIYLIECNIGDGYWFPVSRPFYQYHADSGYLQRALERRQAQSTHHTYRIAKYMRIDPA
jgi:hypothetical protein